MNVVPLASLSFFFFFLFLFLNTDGGDLHSSAGGGARSSDTGAAGHDHGAPQRDVPEGPGQTRAASAARPAGNQGQGSHTGGKVFTGFGKRKRLWTRGAEILQ